MCAFVHVCVCMLYAVQGFSLCEACIIMGRGERKASGVIRSSTGGIQLFY